jgi:hypothetical protein
VALDEANRKVKEEAKRNFREKLRMEADAKVQADKAEAEAKMEADKAEAVKGSVAFPKHNSNVMLKKVLGPAEGGAGDAQAGVDKKKPHPKFETLESIFFALRKSENALNMDPELALASKALAKQEGGLGALVGGE